MEMRWSKDEGFHIFCGSQGTNKTWSSFCFRQLCLGGLETRVSLETYNLGQRGQLFTSKYKFVYTHCFSVISCVQLFATLWTAACQASLSLTVSQSLPKFLSIELVTQCNNLILFSPLLLLPSVFPSIRVFSNDLVLHIRWPKYWSFSISPSHEYSGLISFKIDWLDLLAVQGTLKNLLQHHDLKASILQHWAFFMVQLSHPYMTTGGENHIFY